MDSERWKRVERVYQCVLDSPPERRAAVLEESCSGDPDLLRELESLLKAREQAGSFLSSQQLYGHIVELGSEPAPLIAGSQLGPYQILGEIGAGSMGEVYRAQDTRLGRRVALKILPARLIHDARRVARFRLEAKAASALNHPNIVTIYEIGQADETWFIAEELIEGITLRERLAEGKLVPQEATDIALQCATALEAAHRAGIVHRDIKPENIMVRPDGVVKVLDFGLARISEVGQEANPRATQSGSIMGTPRYMSPEQARGQSVDVRSDVFSLGAVLYEMLTGTPAFPGETTAEVFAALLGSEPPPLGADALDAILSKALAKNREARYRTMREFETDLQRYREQPAPFPKRHRSRSAGTWWNRGLRQGMAVAALALIVVLGLVWYFRTTRNSPEPTNAMTVVPLTTFEGYKNFGSFSPDGKSIAFSWNGGRGGSAGLLQRNIYIKKIGDSAPEQLTFARQDETHPAWSPDGRYIAFCRMIDDRPPFQRFGIYVVPAAGGTPRRITVGGEGVSWSPDGKALVVAGLPPDSGGIFRVALQTGERTRLTRYSQYLDQFPVFSPNGRWIAFTRSFRSSENELFVVRSRGGLARHLTFERRRIYGEAWTADSEEIVFSSNRGSGGESLWRIPVTGGAPRRLSATLEDAFYPAISRQGDRLLYTESYKDTNLYASDAADLAGRFMPASFTAPRRLIASSRRDDSPNISPTNGRIVFVSKRTGDEEIWVCDWSGGNPKQLTSFEGSATGSPRWSPDGRWIAFDSSSAGNSNIYAIGSHGGAPRRLTSGPFGNFMPSWSPDGKRIYFKSGRSGSDQIWWIPAGGGPATELTHGGACEAFASPDGKTVYFTKHAWGAIWSVPAEGGPEKPVPALKRFDRIFRSWGVVRQGIYFISEEPGPRQTVRFFSFATRQVHPLLTLKGEFLWDYPIVALSFDSRRLLVARLDQQTNDLMMVENFR